MKPTLLLAKMVCKTPMQNILGMSSAGGRHSESNGHPITADQLKRFCRQMFAELVARDAFVWSVYTMAVLHRLRN